MKHECLTILELPEPVSSCAENTKRLEFEAIPFAGAKTEYCATCALFDPGFETTSLVLFNATAFAGSVVLQGPIRLGQAQRSVLP